MKRKHIKATFIGKDGYLGYRLGKEYNLELRMGWLGTIHIEPVHEMLEEGACEYDTIIQFLNNWTRILTET